MGDRSPAERRGKGQVRGPQNCAQEIASERATTTIIYVYNLHSDVTDEHIPEIFKDVGEQNQPAVHYDQTGNSKGVAELVFQNYSTALGFLKRHRGFKYKGKELKFRITSDFVPSLEGGCDSSCESGALRLSTSCEEAAPFKTPTTTTSEPDQGFVSTETQFGGKKHLYVCLFSCSESQWHLKVASVAVHSLVMVNSVSYSGEEHATNLLQLDPVIDVSKEAKDFFFGVNLISVSNMIYSFGGALSRAENDDGGPFYFTPSSRNCMAYSTVSGEWTSMASMGSEKSSPIIAEIDGLIYVMSGGVGGCRFVFHSKRSGGSRFKRIVADPYFEVYDPRKDIWRRLDDPPFVVDGKDGKVVVSGLQTFPHFIFEKKLCVSTETNSFSFDTVSEKWESCVLFRGFENCYTDKFPPGIVLTDSRVTEKGGPSFHYFRKIVVCFGDTLISSSINCLVAFLVVDGKVQKMQHLSKVNQHLENEGCQFFGSDKLVDLGGGYICYQFHTVEKMKCVTFKISKIGGTGDGPDNTDFLQFDYLKTSTLIQEETHDILQLHMPEPYLFVQ